MGFTDEELVDVLYTDLSNGLDIPVCETLINNLEKDDLDETTVMQNCTNRVFIDCFCSILTGVLQGQGSVFFSISEDTWIVK